MAKKVSYEEFLKEISSLEDEISVLTGKINESVRNQVQYETEANNLLLSWRQLCLSDKKGTKCIEQIENINTKDVEEHERYLRHRQDKEAKLQELRQKFITLIKTPAPQGETKKSPLEAINLQKSSLISGTSKSNIEEVDFSRLFKNFSIDESTVPIVIQEYFPDKKKKSTKKKTKVPKYDPSVKLSKNPYYGEIYKGTANGRTVCVKIVSKLKDDQLKNLITHYESMRKMTSHPHLLSPVAASKKEGEPKILVELVEGTYASLQDFLKKEDRHEKIGFQTKLRFCKNISSALSWLHGNKIHHLRLKPSNILFTKDWKIKVADYGLGLPNVPNPPEGYIASGHAYYYPPELLEDAKNVSGAVDVYSFGLLVYTLLTEKIPYTEANTIEELKSLIVKSPVKLDSNLYPDIIVTLVNDCITNTFDKRPHFSAITSDEYWLSIHQEMIASGEKKGQAIWLQASNNNKGVNTIPWSEFSKVLWNELKITSVEPLQEECVKTMLYLENDNVKHANWIRFLKWFAPLRTGDEGKEFIGKVVQLLQADWFYGLEYDRPKSDALINIIWANKEILEKNKGKVPFLVRIAASQGDKFCLVYLTPGKPADQQISHVPIDPKEYVESGIYKFITNMAKQKNWFPTKEKRPLETQIFSKIAVIAAKDYRGQSEEKVTGVRQPNSILGNTKYI